MNRDVIITQGDTRRLFNSVILILIVLFIICNIMYVLTYYIT